MRQKVWGILTRAAAAILAFVLIALVIIAFAHRGTIRDHFLASTFEASEDVFTLTEGLHLTAAGERIFLASQPELGPPEDFNRWCSGVEHSEHSHVLGCFSHSEIYLFDVTDERLDGIVEVTAAHELLHAAYARMSPREQDELGTALNAEYERIVQASPRLAERMSVYDDLSSRAFTNELHSILGTEVMVLSDALEEHYAQWFQDRRQIVQLHERVSTVFSDLQARAHAVSDEMSQLRENIETRNAVYTVDVEQYNADADAFRARNDRYEFSDNFEEFNELRTELVDRHNALQLEHASLQSDTERYNSLRDELLELQEIGAELDRSLTSSLEPVDTTPAPSE